MNNQDKMTKYTNLWDETISKLSKHGKTFEEVEYIQGDDFGISKEDFENVARKTDYYAGYGSAKVAEDLKLIADNWWLEREEYDGAESWSYKEKPQKLNKAQAVERLAGGMWNTLSELNDPDFDL